METTETPAIPNTPSIRWQCRRGMLELDMLLLPFFDTIYETLAVEQKKAFIDLLAFPDQEIYAFLIARQIPDSLTLKSIVQSIREFSQQG
ncbi:MAG TPA: succinate dehydrogenase assembly factor 2 [Gammaproteobacteria bacterium]|nr:succinate dehydrogenase assembly factor 2 [Gammaproteobacteria bacterium]